MCNTLNYALCYLCAKRSQSVTQQPLFLFCGSDNIVFAVFSTTETAISIYLFMFLFLDSMIKLTTANSL